MCSTQCFLALLALFAGMARSWDYAVSIGDRIDFYLNDTEVDTVRFESQNITALAYDEVHNVLHYINKQNGNDAICLYNISFVEYECYMKNSGRDIHGLAFDPITQYLFFTDMKEKSINWLSLQPGCKNDVHTNLLIKLDEGIPTDIAVDTCRGYIYWINTNITTSTIERARYDGSQREVLINSTYKIDLHSLAIDQQTRKIYWMMPETRIKRHLYSADLDGKNKIKVERFKYSGNVTVNRPKEISLLKEKVIVLDICTECTSRKVWKFPKTLKPENQNPSYYEINNAEGELAIVGNYKISEQFEGIQECRHLARLVPHYSLKIAREHAHATEPFCVHGQSFCECTTGYVGARCEFSVCENYCVYGNCSLDGDGLPKCRCNAGYTGQRCEVDNCAGYCHNNGKCVSNEKNAPFCQCINNYVGDRCEQKESSNEDDDLIALLNSMTSAEVLAMSMDGFELPDGYIRPKKSNNSAS